MRAVFPASLVALMLAGCRGETSAKAASVVPTWRLSSLPVVDIGVTEGDERLELSSASSSFRLSDGRIVVANSGSSELRFFDREGRFLKASGRKGSGPGEFTGSLQIVPTDGEHFGVYDAPQLSIFDTTGRFISSRIIETGGVNDFPLTVWLHGRNWINGPADTNHRASIRSIIGRMGDLPPGAYRFIKVADDGKLWTQVRTSSPADSLTPWSVFDSEFHLLGNIQIPQELEIHQIGADFLLARRWVDNQVEHIQLYHIEGVSRSAPAQDQSLATRTTSDSASSRTVAALAMAVRNLVTAQELHYMNANGYAEKAAELEWEAPPDTHVHLMAADKRGWVGLLAHDREPVICGMAVGGSTPPGWGEGSPKCSVPLSQGRGE